MSSIIVLDSSDEEPESEKKEPNISKSPKSSSDSMSTKSTSSPAPISENIVKNHKSQNPLQISFKRKSDDSQSNKYKIIKENSTYQSPRNSPTTVTYNVMNQKEDMQQHKAMKRKVSNEGENNEDKQDIKRLKPTLVSNKVDEKWFAAESPVIAIEDLDEVAKTNGSSNIPEKIVSEEDAKMGEEAKCSSDNKDVEGKEEKDNNEDEKEAEEEPINPTFAALLQVCREADPSEDMNTLIKTKLLKYYHSVHPDFVNSKGFCKTVRAVTEEIRSSPQLVYYNLKSVVEELKIRKKNKNTVISNEDVATTGSERKDRQVKRLSRALYILTKKIAKLEAAEVDLDDDNSTYLQTERFKKRACEIYEKICDLTGESKHAHRLVKKPISFQGSPYPEFNKTLQAFVNRTNTFPDYYDVYRCLEHCNAQYGFGLRNDDIKRIAQDAFLKVGKLLQNRRKTDLYETVAHFTSTSSDPALSDPSLNVKLNENQKHHSKIASIIDRFAKEQELVALENAKSKSKPGTSPELDDKIARVEKGDDDNSLDKPKSSADHVSEKCIENGDVDSKGEEKSLENSKEDSRKYVSEPSKKTMQLNASLATEEEIVISDDEDS